MKNKKINEQKKKDSELTGDEFPTDMEFQNKNESQMNLKKDRVLENNLMFWDLSGGLLGI